MKKIESVLLSILMVKRKNKEYVFAYSKKNALDI